MSQRHCNMLITDSDLHVFCQAGGCRSNADYIVTMKATPVCKTYSRLYCPRHTAELLQKAATILLDNNSGDLHDWIETEHINQGAGIDAEA